ncbi:UNVERIFIED_ORG: hypothetical protein FHW05_000301 [Pantoea agglomerans]
MDSPYMTYEEVAAYFRRSVKTIRNWNSRDRRTRMKRMEGFPDPVMRGLFLKNEIVNFHFKLI